MTYYIGIDLGGTSIKSGVVDDRGHVLGKQSTPTTHDNNPDTIIDGLIDAINSILRSLKIDPKQVRAIGVGSPGPVDIHQGIIEAAPNLPQLKGTPIRQRIADATGKPVAVENDANAATLAEFWFGVARDPSIRHLVLLTLGTGIGSGVIVDGSIVHGGHGLGGEAGHMIIVPDGRQCNCGQRGCLEAYASARHTALRAIEAMQKGQPTRLREIETSDRTITAEHVFDFARSGDALCLKIVQETAAYLALGCVNLCRLLDPQLIVIGGGMARAGDYLIDLIDRAFERSDWKMADRRVRIVTAQFSNDAGVIGAAAVAKDLHGDGPPD